MNCVNCDICVYHLGLCVSFPGIFLSFRVTGACPVTTDLILRVNVRTTTTTTFHEDQVHNTRERSYVIFVHLLYRLLAKHGCTTQSCPLYLT